LQYSADGVYDDEWTGESQATAECTALSRVIRWADRRGGDSTGERERGK
jgi:hypothetical protein